MKKFMVLAAMVGATLLCGCTADGSSERGPHFAPGTQGGCQPLYKKYLAARGHAAYASTPGGGYVPVICGTSFSAGSREAAERTALKSCQNGLGRYKVAALRNCEIVASK